MGFDEELFNIMQFNTPHKLQPYSQTWKSNPTSLWFIFFSTVTEKGYESESYSETEDDVQAPKQAPKDPIPAKLPASNKQDEKKSQKKTSASANKGTKQASIIGFFQKKWWRTASDTFIGTEEQQALLQTFSSDLLSKLTQLKHITWTVEGCKSLVKTLSQHMDVNSGWQIFYFSPFPLLAVNACPSQ